MASSDAAGGLSTGIAGAKGKEAKADDYAYNFALTSYDHRLVNRVNSQKLTIAVLEKYTDKDERLRVINSVASDTRPSQMPKPAETAVSLGDKTARHAIWVGMYTSVPKDVAEKEGNAAKSESTFSLGTQRLLPYSAEALRVVSPVGADAGACYALTYQDPVTGLCNGTSISANSVFFFEEFRNDQVLKKKMRQLQWLKKVKKAANESLKLKAVHDYDRLDLAVPKSLSLQTDLIASLANFDMTDNPVHLDNAERALKALQPLSYGHKTVRNIAVTTFLTQEVVPSQALCDSVMEEINSTWNAPELVKLLDTVTLQRVHQCLLAGDTPVPFSHARPFIGLVAFILDARGERDLPGSLADAAALEIATEAWNIIHISFGLDTMQKRPEIQPSASVQYLRAINNSIEECLNKFRATSAIIKDSQGAHNIPYNVPQLINIMGSTTDRDTAQNATVHIFRALCDVHVNAFGAVLGHLKGIADDIAETADAIDAVSEHQQDGHQEEQVECDEE